MKKIGFILVIGLLWLTGCTRPNNLEMAVKRIMEHYPQACMQDVYKSFYQDRFGSEHMITDTAGVYEYLAYELQIADTDRVQNPYYEEVGAYGRYVRVYLRCITEQRVPAERLADTFIRSARPTDEPKQSWADEWAAIEQAALKAGIDCPDEDLQQLRKAAELKRAVRHSDRYRQSYHPHYRIVTRSIFENELEPLINQ